MKASELVAQLQALIAAHGDFLMVKEYFYGGFDPLAGPAKVIEVHACPWMAESYWGEYEEHYRDSEHPSFKVIVID
mgnify:CR=1 FL=1